MLLICFTSLFALLHIAKRLKSLEKIGIYANYTVIKTYVGFWIVVAICMLTSCTILLIKGDQDDAGLAYDIFHIMLGFGQVGVDFTTLWTYSKF